MGHFSGDECVRFLSPLLFPADILSLFLGVRHLVVPRQLSFLLSFCKSEGLTPLNSECCDSCSWGDPNASGVDMAGDQ